MTKKIEGIEIREVDPQEAFRNKDKDIIIALERAASLDLEKDCTPVTAEELNELLGNLSIEEGIDPRKAAANFQAKLQTKAFDYYFALNQILGSILDPAPGTSDRQILEQIERIAKEAFEEEE